MEQTKRLTRRQIEEALGITTAEFDRVISAGLINRQKTYPVETLTMLAKVQEVGHLAREGLLPESVAVDRATNAAWRHLPGARVVAVTD